MVPKLGLDEAIVPVPIVSGTWDLTQLDTQVGLLTTTGRWPGDDWAMALVGHVTVSAAQRGPFADLWKARLNDEVIYRWQGVDYVYAVSEKTNAQPDEVDRLYIPDGDGLVLVTCTDWDYLHFTYAQRLIVRATLVRREALP
jgi:LPXTG-site transpeptidase (sortase) family protein